MKHRIKKISAFLITFLTLGAFTPTTFLEVDAETNKNDAILSQSNEKESNQNIAFRQLEDELERLYESSLLPEELDIDEYFIRLLAEQAKEEMRMKLGPRIYNQVGEELETVIIPTMEEVLHSILYDIGKKEAEYFGITTSSHAGEKIFEVFDERTNEEIARFDVRRDNRPKDGYWFNFHYHLCNDNFEKHHHIGDLYWDKNMPPKWKSS